jgi:hypothetical protein
MEIDNREGFVRPDNRTDGIASLSMHGITSR